MRPSLPLPQAARRRPAPHPRSAARRRSPGRRLLLPLVLLLPGCVAGGVRARPVPRYDAGTLFATTSMSGASFSPDGEELLLTSDASGVFNVVSLDLATGTITPRTRSTTDAVFSLGYFPADTRFLYTADQGGNELNHIYVQDADGSHVDLTPGEGLKASFLGWADDERSFFVLTNERDARHFDLYRYELGSEGAVEASAREMVAPGYFRTLVYRNEAGYDVSDVSGDGRWVALTKVRNNADSDVYVQRLDVPGSEPVHVTPHEGDVSHGVLDFSPDSGTVYYSSNVGSEFDRAWSYDLDSGRRQVAFEDDWDVTLYAFSRDGRYLVTAVNADARTLVRVFEVASGEEVGLPDVPDGDVTGAVVEPGGHRMAFYVTGDTSPANLHLLDLATGRHERLTDNLNPAVDDDDLVAAQVVRYASFDGLQIPALLYRPKEASLRAPAPALVWVHGGPGGQNRRGYHPAIQHLVNHGYAVLAVNNRGSSGYGKTFFHLDDRHHGDLDLKDCVYGRKYLETLPWVDRHRVGIIGGSYGGYLVCAALAFEPRAFDVGVDIFGVTNWLRTLTSIPPWWEDFREALYAEMGDPQKDEERLRAISPLFHAADIERPLLVVQGRNDPRVLQAESDEIVAAVRRKGVPVEYVLFDDEGHGFRGKENRVTASNAYLSFLDEHLRGGAAN